MLRRHERTCKHRAPSIEDKSTETYPENVDSTESRQLKRFRSSVEEENLSNLTPNAPESIDPTAITAGQENGQDTCLFPTNPGKRFHSQLKIQMTERLLGYDLIPNYSTSRPNLDRTSRTSSPHSTSPTWTSCYYLKPHQTSLQQRDWNIWSISPAPWEWPHSRIANLFSGSRKWHRMATR